jgi:hypothetical protein
MVNSFSEVIDALGGATKFSRAIGMDPNTGRAARKRESIAVSWFPKIAELAAERGRHDITVEKLVELASERRAA